MVHHVSFCPEALATVLGTLEWTIVVMNSHMDRQIVPIVEGLLARLDRAYENWAGFVISEVGLEILAWSKLFVTAFEGALIDFLVAFYWHFMLLISFKALIWLITWHLVYLGAIPMLIWQSSLRLSVVCRGPCAQERDSLLGWLLYFAGLVHKKDWFGIYLMVLKSFGVILERFSLIRKPLHKCGIVML